MTDSDVTSIVFAAGLAAGVTLDLLLLRSLLAPPFRLWPAPEPGSWQSLTFWGLFRGGMVATFAVALLDWNSAVLLDWSRLLIGAPLFLVGFGITICGYFNLGFGNTYCGADGLVSHGLYRFSRNPQYASSIMGLAGLAISANSWLAIVLAAVMGGAYVLMALVEEAWLEERYGPTYRDYCAHTARFLDVSGLLDHAERKLRLTVR
ncbi:MAG: methyltransferase family protein [Methyloceanibacter sp.]|uniref:methyltransferase family protein n=1 Tax=Methyloceanibacter sp. TaxID=1965321 RepID=UPI003D9B75DA